MSPWSRPAQLLRRRGRRPVSSLIPHRTDRTDPPSFCFYSTPVPYPSPPSNPFPSSSFLPPLSLFSAVSASPSDCSLVCLSVRPSPARHVSVRAPSVYVTRDTISPGSQNDRGARAAPRRREGAARRRWRKTCARAEARQRESGGRVEGASERASERKAKEDARRSNVT